MAAATGLAEFKGIRKAGVGRTLTLHPRLPSQLPNPTRRHTTILRFRSFANWSKNFYTTQDASYVPQRNDISLFACRRFDLKGFYELPVLEQRFLLSAGVSQIQLPRPRQRPNLSRCFLYKFIQGITIIINIPFSKNATAFITIMIRVT